MGSYCSPENSKVVNSLTSAATLEVHKGESGVETNCHKNQRNTAEVKLE